MRLSNYDKLTQIFIVLGLIGIVVGCFALSAWVLQLLWNFVVPGLFGLQQLTFIQAVGLTALLSVIGSFFKSSSK